MDNFLQAFTEGLDEEVGGESLDESPASRVNVVLRSARRFVSSPEKERAYFEKELEAFTSGLDGALGDLEALFERATESEQALLESAHADLEFLAEQVDELDKLFEKASTEHLDQIVERLLVPTYRLLIAQQALKNLGSVMGCPYCESENARDSSKCESCGKPLVVPDPLKQEGELIAVPPAISQFLQQCFKVAREPDQYLDSWLTHLNKLRHQFGAAQQRILKAQNASSPGFQEFQDMGRGLEVMLAGFDELETFKQSRNAEILDTGWVNMMSGFKVFKLAGDRLATATSS